MVHAKENRPHGCGRLSDDLKLRVYFPVSFLLMILALRLSA